MLFLSDEQISLLNLHQHICYLTDSKKELIIMKNILYVSLISLILIGCSTEIEKLESKRDRLTEKADKLTEEHLGLMFECASIQNQLIPTGDLNLSKEKMEKHRQEVCSKAEEVHREYLPMRFEIAELDEKIKTLKAKEPK